MYIIKHVFNSLILLSPPKQEMAVKLGSRARDVNQQMVDMVNFEKELAAVSKYIVNIINRSESFNTCSLIYSIKGLLYIQYAFAMTTWRVSLGISDACADLHVYLFYKKYIYFTFIQLCKRNY